ncbi:DUF1700 domain-containing protein [Clostridium culturomicium]|uniref:DUF1700 domain-containing protein n=1 Tax=Clostridium culturomicium TaxID=1499683 RepID=UPI00058CB43F|nr:DUF1700 domain-containing protein [Clostridium culturomicium]
MSKNDFLDILRDYLKGTFSQLEINDILRDYEEFFLNGELQGKSDEEIIRGLGSPKSIAQELIEEMKGQAPINDNNGSEVFDKVNKEAKRAWKSAKATGKKAGSKAKEFLDSNSVINGNISSAGVKLIIAIITITIIIFALPIILSMFGSLLALIGMSIANFIGYLGAAVLCGINLSMGIFGFFACIAWTGFLILGWVLYTLAYKGVKYLWVKYISWVRTRKMYVRVKEQQQNTSSNDETKENFENEETECEAKVTEDVYDEEVIIVEPILLEEAKDLENHEDDKEVRGYDE